MIGSGRERNSALTDQRSLQADLPIQEWRADSTRGQAVGAVLASIGLVLLLVTVRQFDQTGGLSRVIFAGLMILFFVLTTIVGSLLVRLRSIRYLLDNSALHIRATGGNLTVPYSSILAVIHRPRDRLEGPRYERYWPGWFDSTVQTSVGVRRSIATTPVNTRVRLRLQSGSTIAISPERPVLFVEAINRLRSGAGVRDVRPAPVPTPSIYQQPVDEPTPVGASLMPATKSEPAVPTTPDAVRRPKSRLVAFVTGQDVRADATASNLLALNVILVVVMVAIAAWQSDAINRPVAIHWDAGGEPTWFISPERHGIVEGVWLFPLTGGLLVIFNLAIATLAVWVHRVPLARFLLLGTLVCLVLLFLGLWRVTGVGTPMLG